jgi:hypothetical protein
MDGVELGNRLVWRDGRRRLATRATRAVFALLIAAICTSPAPALIPELALGAEPTTFDPGVVPAQAIDAPPPPRKRSRLKWTVSMDNDMLIGDSRDRDYTGGFNATLTGEQAARLGRPNYRALQWLDERLGLARLHRSAFASAQQDAVQLGLLAFTPEDIESAQPVPGDRPYASLLFLAHSHYGLNATRSVLHQSTFSVGVLGTGIAEELQRALHDVAGGADPQGYGHQIADGGELTARYAVARHALLREGSGRRGSGFDSKLMLEGSVGYLTEAAVALAVRWGRLDSPWWASVAEDGEYAAQPSPDPVPGSIDASAGRDFYVSAGAKVRARFYNAFLQGQFRDSVLTFAASELRPFLFEAWVGVTKDYADLQLSYLLRYQTAEIDRGVGSRGLAWAGITVAKNF